MGYFSALKKTALRPYHATLNYLASWYYGRPSEKLLVIGVTGTSGKSSTVDFLRQIMTELGTPVGSLSTVDFWINGQQELNRKKMTMLGRGFIQKALKKMVDAGVKVAIVEATSEGAVQYRHIGINFDVMLLTNFYPEHIESHGSLENYRAAKRKLFSYTAKCRRKEINKNKKIAVVNFDWDTAELMVSEPFDEVWGVCGQEKKIKDFKIYRFSEVIENATGVEFSFFDQKIKTGLLGAHSAANLSLAGVTALALDFDKEKVLNALAKVKSVPGRLEEIREAQEKGFSVFVDYAFEPVAMKAMFSALKKRAPARIIHVFGSTGGGRDRSRRPELGRISATEADISIVTDEDPYEDDPLEIIAGVAEGFAGSGKKENKDYFIVPNRAEAIKRAIDIAEPGDLVIISGKGSEQAMAIGGKLIPWDDRLEARRAIANKI